MSEQKIIDIIDRYLAGDASADDITQLDKWYDSLGCQREIYDQDSDELKSVVGEQFQALKLKLGIM